jgi:hypothetical protein
MTFLQPSVLWALPLVLLPVIIHLLNRLRHRSQPWAAMRFLVSATRTSVSQAKLRQFLILLFRVLAVLMLVLFVSRPLAGGWLGWVLAPAPDTILILLDRSASMETQINGTTRREQALKLLSAAARDYEGTSHLILIDSALRTPQEVASAASFPGLSFTAATDTAADLPALLQSALNWLIENRAGTTEIWVASDLQASNWQPADTRWSRLVTQISSLPQKVRIRLLAFNQRPSANTSVAVRELVRRERADQAELSFVVDLERTDDQAAEPIPVAVQLDDTRSQVEVAMPGQSFRWRHKLALGPKRGSGWGKFELPADANLRDNTAYFVYGAETTLRAAVVTTDPQSARPLRVAAAAFVKGERRPADAVVPTALDAATWAEHTLVVWQGTLPEGSVADRLRSFVEEGGVVIFFPSGRAELQRFSGVGWSEVQPAESGREFRILRWDEEQGPLAKTDEGLSLPLPQTTFQRRQLIAGQKIVLAAFDDGTPFLSRQKLGRGEVFFCASLPKADWSSLADGPVLVPMMQRLLQAGSQRLQHASTIECGELSAADLNRQWVCVDATAPKDIRTQAGVYRSGERLLAVNRPASEDEPESLEIAEAQRLFGALPVQMLTERRVQTDALQGEIWRLFLFAMLVFLLAEAALILPGRRAATTAATGTPRGQEPPP